LLSLAYRPYAIPVEHLQYALVDITRINNVS